MPLDRTWFNSLIDDDGSNTVGSIWNKAAVDHVYDDVDAALVAVYGTVVTSTTTGLQTAWAPGLNGHTFVQWNGTADLQLHGLAGGVTGQRVTIANGGGGGNILVSHWASTSAPFANRFANSAQSAATPIAAGGTVTYVYRGDLWSLVAHEQGAWITPPFSAADFTGAGSMAWTVDAGDVTTMRYRLSGRTLTVTWYLGSTTLGGTASSSINIANGQWGGFSGGNNVLAAATSQDPTFAAAFTQIGSLTSLTKISIWKMSGNWTLGTNTVGTYGTLTFEVS